MTTDEFEALLDGAEETDALEFKGAMAWHQSLIKDILALANVQDGGRIVIGIGDDSYVRQGLTGDQVATYNIEEMRDRVAAFADPRVEFRCETVTDVAGLRFVLIEVRPFETVPVICRRDGDQLQAGTLYFRSRARRPASARVSNSSDMRDIIEVAVVRSRQRLARVGFAPRAELGYDYDAELGDL